MPINGLQLPREEFRRIVHLDKAEFNALPEETKAAYLHDRKIHYRRRLTGSSIAGIVIGGKSLDEIHEQTESDDHSSSS